MAAKLSLWLEGMHLSTTAARGTRQHHGMWIFRRGEEARLQSCPPVHARLMWSMGCAGAFGVHAAQWHLRTGGARSAGLPIPLPLPAAQSHPSPLRAPRSSPCCSTPLPGLAAGVAPLPPSRHPPGSSPCLWEPKAAEGSCWPPPPPSVLSRVPSPWVCALCFVAPSSAISFFFFFLLLTRCPRGSSPKGCPFPAAPSQLPLLSAQHHLTFAGSLQRCGRTPSKCSR